ncbi:MAG: hypothetical protein COA33_012250 [Fluviicola sp.]|nr:hypothetical protein [Fluviicola sp.]
MREISKYILFKIALIVIVLHAIIPHPHSGELTDENHFKIHQKSSSLIGAIRLAFHENNHENLDTLAYTQYENAKKLNLKNKKPNIPILNNVQSKIVHRKVEKTECFKVENFNRILFAKLNGLRGPPY